MNPGILDRPDPGEYRLDVAPDRSGVGVTPDRPDPGEYRPGVAPDRSGVGVTPDRLGVGRVR